MLYCSHCGNQVGDQDAYCGRCGATQPPSGPTAQATALSDAINPRTASILCYVPWLGFIAALLVLAAERYRHDRMVRFHAFQGLYLFVAQLLNHFVIGQTPFHFPGMALSGAVGLVLTFAAVFMIVKTAQGVTYSLPLFGELAERSANED